MQEINENERPRRKRQRLDHLTAEEKVLRRKMKNRLAAQSARDRKRLRMMDLEEEVKRLAHSNKELLKHNASLQDSVHQLNNQNDELRALVARAEDPLSMIASKTETLSHSSLPLSLSNCNTNDSLEHAFEEGTGGVVHDDEDDPTEYMLHYSSLDTLFHDTGDMGPAFFNIKHLDGDGGDDNGDGDGNCSFNFHSDFGFGKLPKICWALTHCLGV